MKKIKRLSSTILISVLFRVVVLFVISIIAYNFIFSYQLKKTLEKNLSNYLDGWYKEVDKGIVEYNESIAESFSKSILLDRKRRADVYDKKVEDVQQINELKEVYFTDSEGIIEYCSIPEINGRDIHEILSNKELLAMIDSNEDLYFSREPEASYVESSQKVYYFAAKDSDSSDYLICAYPEEWIEEMRPYQVKAVSERDVGLGLCYYILLDKETKEIITGVNSQNNESSGEVFEGADLIKADSASYRQLINSTIYGVERYLMYDEYDDYIIIVAVDQKTAIEEGVRTFRIVVILMLLVISLLSVLIVRVIRSSILINLAQVNQSLRLIAQGNLDTKLEVREFLEFSELSDDINSTVGALKEYSEEAKKKIEKDLEMASKIQTSLLPTNFQNMTEQVDLYATMKTAREVGGDFYDFYMMDENHIVILIADVSGKGIPAAMFMMMAKSTILSFIELGCSVDEAFILANEKLKSQNEAKMFVTAWMGCLNLRTGELSYVNAGHNPPIIGRSNGEFSYLKVRPNLALGGRKGIKYQLHTEQLMPGDIIYLYTDGVTEAENTKQEMLGTDALLEAMRKFSSDDHYLLAQQGCSNINELVKSFAGDAEQSDDITMLWLRYLPIHGVDYTMPAILENIMPILAFMDDFFVRESIGVKDRSRISIVIEELLSNIAKFSYDEDSIEKKEMTVRATYHCYEKKLFLTFVDSGKAFNPLEHNDEEQVADRVKKCMIGGLGIHMVLKTMDGVYYEYQNGKNILTVEKKFEE